MSTRSRDCRPRSLCSSSAARRAPAPRSAASRRSPTCCACCTRAPAPTGAAVRCCMRRISRRTRRKAHVRACHGLGYVYEVTERSMVPDDSLSIRDRAVAAWPPAWHGQNLRDILVSLGYDVDTPWRDLAEKRPRLDPIHRRAADRARVCRLHAGGDAPRPQAQGGAQLHGDLHRRAQVRAADLRDHPKRAHEEARGALHDGHLVPDLPRASD